VKGKPLNSNNKMSPPPKSPYLGDSEKIANLEFQIAKLIEGQTYMLSIIDEIEQLKKRQNATDKIIQMILEDNKVLVKALYDRN
jgi:hypothetical protein